ncbi:PepSY-associated TM helix domain-containing protein [Sphingomonas glacialis]|nr:PepSY-associated TM helix domain-containing protein [Sphingomonas glacialis]
MDDVIGVALHRGRTVMQPVKRKTRLTARQFHRWLGIGAAVLFLLVSITGVALQYQQIFGSEEAAKEAAASIVSPLSLAKPTGLDPAALDHARAVLLARYGNRPIAGVDWQIKAPTPAFVFHLDGADPRKVAVGVATAAILSDEPDGEDWLIRLHSGEIIGDGGKFLGLLWGLGLVAMTLTGVWLYIKMYRARQKGSASRLTGWRRYLW